jgi:uncharacterized membrane protein YgcG
MLERVTWGHHLAVGAVIAGAGALAWFGIIGEPDRPERFDAKHVTVWPIGDDGLRIREVIDQDFGTQRRRGHERFVPTDFGDPVDVTAASPDAPDDLSVTPMGNEVRFRIGDPDVTITGQHRYVLEYTLPDAQVSSGVLALDIIGTDETFRTDRFEVVVVGLELADPTCSVGRAGATGGCVLERDGDVYRTVISPLEPAEGITIGGQIVGRPGGTIPAAPEIPERRSPHPRELLAIALVLVGVATAAFVYVRRARRGRNEVFVGGAADAAFGELPPPAGTGSATAGASTQLVTDRRIGDLATIEFAPPSGLEPWEGAVLLSERITDDTVGAWFSGLAGQEAIVLEPDGKRLRMRRGPTFDEVDVRTAELLRAVLPDDDPVELGAAYDATFSSAWRNIKMEQDRRIRESGWWKHQPPQSGTSVGCGWQLVVFAAIFLLGFSPLLFGLFGLLGSIPLAVLFTILTVGVTAWAAYSALHPARSATGSALTLRTESFRRFLDASEGQHVQWAWERGVLREYTAWAVALGEAEAWSRALAASNLPEAGAAVSSPMLVHSMRSSFASATTAPSSSSSGSGGGFSSSGGSVGGGGGGGRSGSW